MKMPLPVCQAEISFFGDLMSDNAISVLQLSIL